ncbi:unnamed protein product [Leptosia nina]|uniref:Uncharacterized protein n=1 Tax=Leptosia nina TaxID=320188 RepID=A0AAV1JTE5_9NEOP
MLLLLGTLVILSIGTDCIQSSALRSDRPIIRLEALKTTKLTDRRPCKDGTERCLKLKSKVLQDVEEDTTTSTAPPVVGIRKTTTPPLNISFDMERCADVAKCNLNIW